MTIEDFEEEFINYMDKQSNCGVTMATAEFEAIKDDIDLNIDDPVSYADDCMSCWHE